MVRSNQDKALDPPSILQQPVAKLEPSLADYGDLLEEIKERIRTTQVRAALAVNRELVTLYWDIGRLIVERQHAEGWGASTVNRLAEDLQAEFPGVAGFSAGNVRRMRAFYRAWSDSKSAQPARILADDEKSAQPVRNFGNQKLPTALAEIPWGHNLALVEKLKDPTERLWYAEKAVEHGWSRNVLVHQIESDLYHRQGGAISNFHATLPAPQSDLAHQLLKDPYVFDFLTLTEQTQERELEQALIDRVESFLLELGTGFAFVGRQYHLEVGGEDFYIDLLFYHLHLRRYVVIELKTEKFKPEFAGKLNFYLAVADDVLRRHDDQPTIGLLICKEKNRVIAEYSLRDMSKPMGLAEYALTSQLPAELSDSLPAIEQIEQRFSRRVTPKVAIAREEP